MYNLIVPASRPSEWTHEQFIEWWCGEHAEVTYPCPEWKAAVRHVGAMRGRRMIWSGDEKTMVPLAGSRE